MNSTRQTFFKFGDGGRDVEHFADTVVPGDRRQRARLDRVVALYDVDYRWVHRTGEHLHQHALTGARARLARLGRLHRLALLGRFRAC